MACGVNLRLTYQEIFYQVNLGNILKKVRAMGCFPSKEFLRDLLSCKNSMKVWGRDFDLSLSVDALGHKIKNFYPMNEVPEKVCANLEHLEKILNSAQDLLHSTIDLVIQDVESEEHERLKDYKKKANELLIRLKNKKKEIEEDLKKELEENLNAYSNWIDPGLFDNDPMSIPLAKEN